jgi:branched-subunit amino acid ABC-type transport system permease component
MIRKLIALASVILISGISLLLMWSMLGTVKMADSAAMDTAKALYKDGNYPNLALARTEAGISSDLSAVNPLLEISSLSKAWVSLNEISVIALAAWITSGALILIYLILSKTSTRKLIGTLAIISLVITLGASITFTARIMADNRTRASIVTKPNTILRDSPKGESEGGVELPAGTRTQVIEQHGDWVLLTTLDQIVEGWAPEDAIEYLAF